jgi:Holliday junction DNA helicase RuvA
MVLELKDKIHIVAPATAAAPSTASGPLWREQVSQGLEGLGWSARDAEAACAEVEHLVSQDSQVSVAVLMRAALQSLAR